MVSLPQSSYSDITPKKKGAHKKKKKNTAWPGQHYTKRLKKESKEAGTCTGSELSEDKSR